MTALRDETSLRMYIRKLEFSLEQMDVLALKQQVALDIVGSIACAMVFDVVRAHPELADEMISMWENGK